MPFSSDQGGRAPSSRSLRIRGLIAAVVLAVAGTMLYQLGTGGYANTFKVTVMADTLGEGLTPGAEVKFRGLTIGSVKTLQSAGFNKQKITLELEPRQAAALAADTTANFMSSNTFGLAAVELVSSGSGPRLSPNQTLVVDTNSRSASITGLLRQGQKFGRIMDSPDVDHIISIVRKHADLTEPVTRSYFDLVEMLTDSQKVPFSQSLSVLASVINGVNDAVPLVSLAYDLLNGMDFLAHPDGVDRMNLIMDQLAKLLFTTDGIFAKHMTWLVPLTGGIMSVWLPAAYYYGSMSPAYDRISGLLDRTSTAFPIINGKVRLNIELTLDAMPGLAAALPTGAAPDSPPAPAQGGGR
ncbi:MlaD family protein [Mycobacterium sp. CVI_P3]|uniref:MlaD family protein n=1 Tax=Mycobacterium pinniadriaticum TaxID=2994102 RepID=A0ABT3SGB3_9MYCO|nr:MlaD family protein [Mycobacterium pinniadriaticum]MCX2932107.1 MlaD family protein [Mycobacterium pinniadriaticum]MCX2938531.1 MlaD family protein [Mycobacterium pinniadriaticum]